MKWTTEMFVEKARLLYGTLYDYSNVAYVDRHTKVIIGCKIHGSFEIQPSLHLHRNIGCGKCGKIKASTNRRIGTGEFIQRARGIHSDYNYELVEYVNTATKIKIICPLHGLFQIRPGDLLTYGQGCKQCGVIKSSKTRSMTIQQFINLANDIHGVGTYDYSNVNMVNSSTKVKIICPTHGGIRHVAR